MSCSINVPVPLSVPQKSYHTSMDMPETAPQSNKAMMLKVATFMAFIVVLALLDAVLTTPSSKRTASLLSVTVHSMAAPSMGTQRLQGQGKELPPYRGLDTRSSHRQHAMKSPIANPSMQFGHEALKAMDQAHPSKSVPSSPAQGMSTSTATTTRTNRVHALTLMPLFALGALILSRLGTGIQTKFGSRAGPAQPKAAMMAIGEVTPLVTEAAAPLGTFQGSYGSLYVALGLYLMSFPGLFSLIKRAAKENPKRKQYVVAGPEALEGAKQLKQVAGEVMGYMKTLNFQGEPDGDVIIFKGNVQPSKSQAYFLTVCTAVAMASLALILQTFFKEGGNYWYLLCLTSPYAGIYYWQNAQRDQEIQIKIQSSDDGKETIITALGLKEDLERMSSVMGLQEKGMVRVKGVFEG